LPRIGLDIAKARELLKKSEVVGIPTETVYGLAANAYDENAVKKIFKIKNRPYYDPLIVHTHSLETIKEFTEYIPDIAIELGNKFWPGPLTLLLHKNKKIPDIVTSSLPLVGVRIPNNELTLQLLNNLDFPLAAPSANKFNYISPTKPEHIQKNLGQEVPYILDGGTCNLGIESTIVGFENDNIIIYRLGIITLDDIKAAVNNQSIQIKILNNTKKISGAFAKHYSPKTPMVLTENILNELKLHTDKNIGVLTFNSDLQHPNIQVKRILSPSADLFEAAKNLYSYLIDLDNANIELILACPVPNTGIGIAINDRLTRAAYKS
jgi:L-threonylcarbamoyladenylate synthase